MLSSFNFAVALLAMGFAPRKTSFIVNTKEGYFVASREWEHFIWIMAASIIFTLGVYCFASMWLHASEADAS